MKRRLAAVGAVLALSSLLAACSGGGASTTTGSASEPTNGAGPVEVTVWSWVADLQKEADVYNQTHPDVKVKVVNAGNDTAHFEKVRNAITSGSGIPDAFFNGPGLIPSFAAQGQIQDLNQFGADKYEGDQTDAAWAGMSYNGKVYGTPAGIGPIMMYYRTDIYEKYGIEVPKTWDEFRAVAEKLKAAAPDVSITNYPSDYNIFNGLVAQTGQESWGIEGENTVVINFDDTGAAKVADYWQSLLDKDLVSTEPFLTPEYNQAFSQGKVATLIGGSWLPLVMKPNAGASEGKWAVAPIPQWKAGENKTGDAGLAGYSIPKGAPHAQEAADFLFWLTNSEESVKMLADVQSQTPSYLPVLTSEEYLSVKDPFFGGQEARRVVADAAQGAVPQAATPVHDYALPQLAEALGQVVTGEITTQEAVTKVQQAATKFAEEQGYTVKK
ncbi:ABC transporter substrate-binding protein [Pseudarthrobacter scleromae]|uniref:ABC transporter substrate-binding protein n=1 Tax=Pseudarthrobacter scleromae TaxID=158897 RepID=UPI003CFBE5BB